MAGNGTVGDTTTVGACMSDDIVHHRLQDLTVSSTSDASPVGAMSSQPTPPSLPSAANNSIADVTSVQTRALTSSCSKGTMAAKLDRLRCRHIFQGRLPPPSVAASLTDEPQKNLVVGAAGFRPTAHELIGGFLRPMIAGRPLPRAARFIHDADVYATAPYHLAATHAPVPAAGGRANNKLVWYFFSPLHYQTRYRKTTPCRLVGGSGIWKAAVNRRRLTEEGEATNWYEMSLIYYELRHGGSSESKKMITSPTEWQMREYGIAQGGGGGGQLHPLVLCEVFRSPSCRGWS